MTLVVCVAQLSGDVHHSLCHTCDILCDILLICLNHMVQEGPFAGKTLALQAGPFAGESVAKHDILL
jgi:hypothetical protein